MQDKASSQLVTLIVTIGLAFCGYIYTYISTVKHENRNFEIRYVNEQIQNLYGPLYALSKSSEEAWRYFRSRWRPGKPYFSGDETASEAEIAEWRLWIKEVFMPINLKMEDVIVKNSHLLIGNGMNESLTSFMAHVETYKAILKRWEEGDYTQKTAYINYPSSLDDYIEICYLRLKERQARLLDRKEE